MLSFMSQIKMFRIFKVNMSKTKTIGISKLNIIHCNNTFTQQKQKKNIANFDWLIINYNYEKFDYNISVKINCHFVISKR